MVIAKEILLTVLGVGAIFCFSCNDDFPDEPQHPLHLHLQGFYGEKVTVAIYAQTMYDDTATSNPFYDPPLADTIYTQQKQGEFILTTTVNGSKTLREVLQINREKWVAIRYNASNDSLYYATADTAFSYLIE